MNYCQAFACWEPFTHAAPPLPPQTKKKTKKTKNNNNNKILILNLSYSKVHNQV